MRARTCNDPDPDVDEPNEDFVEGGVELSPKKSADDQHHQVTFETVPLPPLKEGALEDVWPSKGTGMRALFLDYDGTLREFEHRPELATPTPAIKELLQAINDRRDLAPHIISGRDAAFLGAEFGFLDHFTLIAEHGFQIWRPGPQRTNGWEIWDHPDGLDSDHSDWKAIIRKEMSEFVTRMPGSFIEEKASSLVWHYRSVSDDHSPEDYACEVMEHLDLCRGKSNIGKIRVSHGHKVVEVSYRKVRKGPVMRRICEEKALFGDPFLSVLVAGDDTSDESMFELAPEDFLTIKVGQQQTAAKFRVESPSKLRDFLWELIAVC